MLRAVSSLLLAFTTSFYEGLTSRFYEGLNLQGGSISDFRTFFCFALEVLIYMFEETDNFC